MEKLDGDALRLSSGLLEVEHDMINVSANVKIEVDNENDPLLEDDPNPSFFDLHSPLLPRKIRLKRRPKSSWVWEHFKVQQADKKNALCLLCSKNIYYGLSCSTGMLECHIRRSHVKEYSEAMKNHAQEKLLNSSNDNGTADLMQSSINGFVVTCPTFESYLLKWMIKTYQPC